MIRTIAALVAAAAFSISLACSNEQEPNIETGVPTASQAVASPPPGSAWVSYLPQTAQVGTRVQIQGNVGQGALDVSGAAPETRRVRVEFWKFDEVAGMSYAQIVGNIPYDDQGDFRGEVVIPPELSPHQADPDTPNFRVGPGTYSFRFHPVDVGLQSFVVTGPSPEPSPASASTSPHPGSARVSYQPHSGPVGTRVKLVGNVGQAILDTDGGAGLSQGASAPVEA
jgi:hypothetical protein